MFLKYAIGVGTALAISVVGVTGPALAKVEGDTITLGSALSFTGKYATNGIHTLREVTTLLLIELIQLAVLKLVVKATS